MPDISAVKSMSAQEAKIRHQREYQKRVEAARKGQAPGRVLENVLTILCLQKMDAASHFSDIPRYFFKIITLTTI